MQTAWATVHGSTYSIDSRVSLSVPGIPAPPLFNEAPRTARTRSNLIAYPITDTFAHSISGMVCCRAAVLCLTEPNETGKILGLFAVAQGCMVSLSHVVMLS